MDDMFVNKKYNLILKELEFRLDGVPEIGMPVDIKVYDKVTFEKDKEMLKIFFCRTIYDRNNEYVYSRLKAEQTRELLNKEQSQDEIVSVIKKNILKYLYCEFSQLSTIIANVSLFSTFKGIVIPVKFYEDKTNKQE